jgi:hypothetical protein
MTDRAKQIILLSIIIITFIATFFVTPFSQNVLYHLFADTRPILGVKNSFDVLSNIPFLFTGFMGLVFLKKYPVKVAKTSWFVFFVGIILIGPGSAYYHDTPNNQTLVWDRLPMTIGFMGLFSALIASYVSEKSEKVMLPLAVLFGLASVVYWAKYDDLRFYYYVQFIPLASIPLILAMFKSDEIKKSYLGVALLFYVLAKVVEATDVKVFAMTGGLISGHTIKHLFAAMAPVTIAYMFKSRHSERSF